MKKSTKYIIKFVIGIAILAILLTKVGLEDILSSFKNANPGFISLAILAFIIALFSAISNVHLMILGLCKPAISFAKTIKYYLLSWSAGLLMPGKLGDFTMIYFLKNEKIPMGQGTAVSITDKIITLTTILLLGSFGFFLFFELEKALYFTVIFIAIAFTGLFSLISRHPRKLIKKILGKKAKLFKGFSKSMMHYAKTKKLLLSLNLSITMFQWVMSAVSVFFLFIAFGVNIPIPIIVLITAVFTLFALVPLTISGLGIKESIAVFLYTELGYDPVIVASVYIIALIMKYTIAFLANIIYKL